jgi:hypothetical protein
MFEERKRTLGGKEEIHKARSKVNGREERAWLAVVSVMV